MLAAEAKPHGVQAVAAFAALLDDLLAHAETVKPSASIEPALEKADFENVNDRVVQIVGVKSTEAKNQRRFAIIETAVRDIFTNCIATTSIESPGFVRVWNLLDILAILSDDELCDPALLFWLVEELLDSQAIPGCWKVFDFLESRRDRITAKHFKQKQLIILRTCNELLRRLSRALDPTFCGRVFIFMFQSFPLGDKSSVNLRGEYHVENVTIFDRDPPPPKDESNDKMDVDEEAPATTDVQKTAAKTGAPEVKKSDPSAPDLDKLYPIFWSLQESFNQPKRLLDTAQFASFKVGLEMTMSAFRGAKTEQGSRSKEKHDRPIEDGKRSTKRKSDELGDELASEFNPKYLTSRDLFALEISDVSFRRNILVQTLIIMDFLLSLSPKAKEKLTSLKTANKSVTYSDLQLSEEDTKWVLDMKRSIGEYLRQGHDGPFYYRMVETVLSRDKNWVRWKMENCPPIELPPLSPQVFAMAKASATKLATSKRLRPTPLGSLNLEFLNEDEDDNWLEKFKDPERYEYPSLESLSEGIKKDQLDVEMPLNSQMKADAIERKRSKTWKALRLASRTRLAVFDKIDDDDAIDVLFENDGLADAAAGFDEQANGAAADGGGTTRRLKDSRPIVVVDVAAQAIARWQLQKGQKGPHSQGSKVGLARQLCRRHEGTLTWVLSQTTRAPYDGEESGQNAHFVSDQEFGRARDNDHFLVYEESETEKCGIIKETVDKINDLAAEVPVLEMGRNGAQQVKDNGYSARFIFVRPGSLEALEAQLGEIGPDDSGQGIPTLLKTVKEDVEFAEQNADFYDSVVVAPQDGEGKDAVDVLEAVFLGSTVETTTTGLGTTTNGDVVNGTGGEEAGGGTGGSHEVEMVDAAKNN